MEELLKEMAVELVEQLGIEHQCLSSHQGKGFVALIRELVTRDYRLYQVVKQFQPDAMAAIGGTFIAHVGRLTNTKSVVFYDTENAHLQNAITYPLASLVAAPNCYEGWLPKQRHLRYRGYHELSYLHPHYFEPQREIAIANGLAEHGDTFLLRLVSWQANHDIGERGWSISLVQTLINRLSPLGKVLISSEQELPEQFRPYQYRGGVAQIHHVMAHCRAFVGESATMASEAAVLGVPAIYVAHTGRGYTNEQERRYGLVTNLFSMDWGPIEQAIDNILERLPEHWKQARTQLLKDTIDVAAFASQCIKDHMYFLDEYQQVGDVHVRD